MGFLSRLFDKGSSEEHEHEHAHEHEHGEEQEPSCSHLDQIGEVTPAADGCVDCLATGDEWHHLRVCMTCGYVGCCDSSPNKHASGHARTVGHPIVQSFEPGEDWFYCYVDDFGFEIEEAPSLSYPTGAR
ncbi:MAG TPA: UBP-type zinc finger domain-containing protein [Actinomycetota bacterium]|nr:UBP-type zinc finger domain-containing protein [Actinomycetota bacterium]